MKFPVASAIVVLFAFSELSQAEQSYILITENSECFEVFKESFFGCELKLIGRKRLLNGTFTFGEDMASDSLFSSPKRDDKLKQLPIGIPYIGNFEGFKDYYKQMVQPSLTHGENTDLPFMPNEGLCPFSKGEYFIKNIKIGTDYLPNQLPRGFMKAVLTFSKDEENVGRAVRIEEYNWDV